MLFGFDFLDLLGAELPIGLRAEHVRGDCYHSKESKQFEVVQFGAMCFEVFKGLNEIRN
jgi:hypothetical protein